MLKYLSTLVDFTSPTAITIYIVIAVVLVVLVIFLIVYPRFKSKHDFENYKNKYYKKIREIADKQDYYLVNNLTIKSRDKLICRIDHILFGEKYIYVIKDRYYRGAISGEKADSTWLFHSKKGTVHEMDSPMLQNEKRMKQLSQVTQIDYSFLISIVIINDNCEVKSNSDLNSDNSFIVSLSQLPKLIKMIESRDVAKLNEAQLEKAVNDLSRLYGQGSNKKQNEK